MLWRRRHCCLVKMPWHAKQSFLHILITGFLLLTFVLIMVVISNCQDWLLGKMVLKGGPIMYNNMDVQQQINHSRMFHGASHANMSSLMNFLGAAASRLRKQIDSGEVNMLPNRYIINEPHVCQSRTPFLILLVTTKPAQVDSRNAIRDTWGNQSLIPTVGLIRLFLLGRVKDVHGDLQESVEKESRLHHDIIQGDYLDTYRNLTVKTLMGIRWVAQHCPHASYVMKTDSDMFVNTEYLIHKVLDPELPVRQNYFTGKIMRSYSPNRNRASKWYVPAEMYPGERYPTFCSGTGYVFSADLCGKIYKASLRIPLLYLEDVYVGICLSKLGVEPTPPPNEFLFNHWRVSYSICAYSHLVTSHQLQPRELLIYWSHLQSNKHKPCRTAKT